jgi:4'-phosphopantetheinyl transferase
MPLTDRPPAEDHPVAVWRVALDPGEEVADDLRRHLSPEETERLQRLNRTAVGRRWLVSRGSLREILATELGTAPSSVRIRLGPHGRPALDPDQNRADLDFNLSHSGDLALVAVARGMRVGIDVERLRPGRDPLRIADRYFSAAEVEAVRAFPEADRPSAFLRYWTAKEALAKGLGLGLRAPIGGLELAMQPGGAMVPVRHAKNWRLFELSDLPGGYLGALAADDEEARFVIRDWPFDELD